MAKRIIPVLKPSLPNSERLLPWLAMIDENHWYSNFGPLNIELNHRMRDFFDGAFVATTSCGTSALELALAGLDLKPQSKVLIPALTFPASISAILRNNLQPVLCDIDSQNWQLSPSIAENLLSEHEIKAVMPVSAFSVDVNADEWDVFSMKYNCPVVIDAAGAFGNQKIGKETTTVFSLHATKSFSSGEGGLVVNNNEQFIKKISHSSNFGIDPQQNSVIYPYSSNAKMSEYHSAVGLASFEIWDEQKRQRLNLLRSYHDLLTEFDNQLCLQKGIENKVISIFNIRFLNKIDIEKAAASLNACGIQTRRWYYPLIQDHWAFKHLNKASDLSVARKISDSILGIPFHLHMDKQDVEYICKAIAKLVVQ